MKLILKSLTISLVFAASAHAVCGDVNLDNKITATDAVQVLNESVGLDGHLACQPSDPTGGGTSILFVNHVRCSTGSTYYTDWQYLSKRWYTPPVGFGYNAQEWDTTKRRIFDGTITSRFGNCGTIVWDFDDRYYPLFTGQAVRFNFIYVEENNTVLMLAAMVPKAKHGGAPEPSVEMYFEGTLIDGTGDGLSAVR
jgi:hypothetical protein